MREILITQLNVLFLILFVFIAGLFPRTTGGNSSEKFSDEILYKYKSGAVPVTKCVIFDRQMANPRIEYFDAGTDCEQMRKLAKEGKPLPTINISP